MKESKEKTVWACGYCGKLHWDKKSADLCHNDKVCEMCGKPIDKKSYYTVCDDCRKKKAKAAELELFEKADKYTVDEYAEKFPNYYVVIDGDRYISPDDLEYEFDEYDEKPMFVWGTKKDIVTIDPYDIIGSFEESTNIEDYEIDREAAKSIVDFFKEWNEKYGQEVFYETTKVAVLLDD